MRLFIDILLVSLFCNGWYLITHGAMILNPLRQWYLNYAGGIDKADGSISWALNYKPIPRVFYKPLFGCIICLSSIIGSISYWAIYKFNFTNQALIYWPIICISASYGNYLLYLIIKKLEE